MLNRRLTIVVIALLTLIVSPSLSFAETPRAVDGVYILNPVDKPAPASILKAQNINGISLRVSWKELESKQGKYDWSYLDKEIEKARNVKKVITLRALAGIHTPNWVYSLGVKKFEFIDKNPHHGESYRGERATFGNRLRIPIPWDEVFLKEWERLIAALGERYGKYSDIVIIHVTGPNRHSAEMILPKEPQDKLHWKEIGYTPRKLTESWMKCIDLWAQAFPSSSLSLNLAPVIFDDGVMEAVAEYGVSKYGRRFLLQNNALTDNFKQRRPDFKLIEKYSDRTTVGFQMLAMSTSKIDKRQGDLKESIDHGLALGARYFEIYPKDVVRLPKVIKYTVGKIENIKKERR